MLPMVLHFSRTPSAKASARKYVTRHVCLDDLSSYNSMTGLYILSSCSVGEKGVKCVRMLLVLSMTFPIFQLYIKKIPSV
jgi:hypothetical protein